MKPVMVDDSVVNRWLRIEMMSVNRALVTNTRPIGDLVREDAPVVRARSGDEHVFDRESLERLHAALSPLDRRRVKLPITIWVDKDVDGSVFVTDAAAVRALQAVGRVGPEREMEGARFWLAHSLARDAANAFPTIFQFAYC